MPTVKYNLNVDLGNYKSFEKAQQVFGKFSRKLDNILTSALQETGEKMEKKCREILESPEYKLGDSDLAKSITLTSKRKTIKLVAEADYADFVEFGTGIIGKNGKRHPRPPESWEPDKKGHGYDGWFYYDEKLNKLRWTLGQESRPFMYRTWQYGTRIVGSQVNKHLNRALKDVIK